MTQKMICVRNDVDRVYNGIQYGQIIKIPEDRLEYYTDLGFNPVENPNPDEEKTPEAPKGGDNGVSNNKDTINPDIQARIKWLKDHNLPVAGNWKEATIIAKSDEAGYKTPEAPKGGDNGDGEAK